MALARTFIASTLLTAIAAVVGVGAFNFWIDPFMQYRMPWYQPRFSAGFARHINAGLARNLDFDAVVVGSSYVVNFSNRDFDREFGGRTISLAMPGMFVSEGEKALAYAYTLQPLKRVFFGLDSFAFDESQNRYQFPKYLYDESLVNDAPYVLSLDTMKRSINIVLNRALDTFNTDPDMPWSWAKPGTRFGSERALSDYAKEKAKFVAATPLQLALMRRVAGEHITRLLVKHPETEFHFFLPPYSVLRWILDADQGNLGSLLEFRILLAELIHQHRNGHLHDFQSMRSLICDLDHYTDVGHYRPEDNKMMVSAMRSGKYIVSPQAIRANNAVLEEIVLQRCSGAIAIP